MEKLCGQQLPFALILGYPAQQLLFAIIMTVKTRTGICIYTFLKAGKCLCSLGQVFVDHY